MKTRPYLLPVLALLSLALSCAGALAETEKERMIKRAPAIRTLKDQGQVGEMNTGLLGFPTDKKPQAKLIAAENADRVAVYAAIAKSQKTSPDHVAKRRYLQLVKQAKPGDYLQDEKGTWHRKSK